MSKTEKLSKANEWLEKAIRFESEGKSERMIEMAFSKAVSLENEAFET